MLRGIRARTLAGYLTLFIAFTFFLLLVRVGSLSIAGAIIMGLLCTLIIAWFTQERVVKPIEQITWMAQEMAGGILDAEIKIHGHEEIDDLAWSVNYMAKELRKTLTDITEERNRVQAILNSMADGVIALDRHGYVLLVNPVVEEIFDLTADSVVGKSILGVIRNYELEQLLNRALQTRQSISQQINLLTPEPRIFRLHATPLLGTKRENIGVVALLQDVTERRKLDQMRSEFVANVSHELRTPLTSINGFLETLIDGAIDEPQVARQFLDIMKAETDRLVRLVNDLLQLSHIEDKQANIKREPVQMAKLIQQVEAVFKPRAEEKGLNLEVAVVDPPLPEIMGDGDLLYQVLVNLVDNAIKYTARGSVVIKAAANSRALSVKVIDTGRGIPKENIPRIFERFYRVDKARDRGAGGTGLGLAIAKHVAEAHGGTIGANSSSQGTTFTFTLPLNSSLS